MAVTYDPNVMQQFAEKLYSRANGALAGYALLGLILGGIGGAIVVGSRMASSGAVIFACAGVGAAIGARIGWEKGFALRLEAQRVLCLLQTEINTRPRQSASA